MVRYFGFLFCCWFMCIASGQRLSGDFLLKKTVYKVGVQDSLMESSKDMYQWSMLYFDSLGVSVSIHSNFLDKSLVDSSRYLYTVVKTEDCLLGTYYELLLYENKREQKRRRVSAIYRLFQVSKDEFKLSEVLASKHYTRGVVWSSFVWVDYYYERVLTDSSFVAVFERDTCVQAGLKSSYLLDSIRRMEFTPGCDSVSTSSYAEVVLKSPYSIQLTTYHGEETRYEETSMVMVMGFVPTPPLTYDGRVDYETRTVEFDVNGTHQTFSFIIKDGKLVLTRLLE